MFGYSQPNQLMLATAGAMAYGQKAQSDRERDDVMRRKASLLLRQQVAEKSQKPNDAKGRFA